MDMKLFRKHLQTISEDSNVRYATKYPGFTVALPPDKNGTIVTRDGKKHVLKVGDVVTIVDHQGKVFNSVKLTSVVDVKHEPLGGKVHFKMGTSTYGTSGNGIDSIEKA